MFNACAIQRELFYYYQIHIYMTVEYIEMSNKTIDRQSIQLMPDGKR